MRPTAIAPSAAHQRTFHAAIVLPRCLDLILSGEKRVEARLTLTRREPFGRIAEGDLIYFKERGGPYRARAVVGGVLCVENLSARAVAMLAAEYEPLVRSEPGFWHKKRSTRFGTFIVLTDVQPCDEGPAWVSRGAAWRTFAPGKTPKARRPEE